LPARETLQVLFLFRNFNDFVLHFHTGKLCIKKQDELGRTDQALETTL
jgi:hypothetical protein